MAEKSNGGASEGAASRRLNPHRIYIKDMSFEAPEAPTRAPGIAKTEWKPETKVARQIREAIVAEPDSWEAATRRDSFVDTWSIDDDDQLKRVPKEFADAEYADDTRLRSFIAGSRITQKTVTSAPFDDDLGALYEEAADLNRFLCAAIGLPF